MALETLQPIVPMQLNNEGVHCELEIAVSHTRRILPRLKHVAIR